MDETSKFTNGIIRLGVVTIIAAIVANFLPAIYLLIVHGTSPSFADILKIYGMIIASFFVSWIVQPLSFYPLLGVSASYISWVSGTVSSLRIPPRTMALRAAEAEDGTHEGEVIGLIGVVTSVFVQVAIVTLFYFIGSTVLPMLPAFIIDAFKYILPAIFGAIYADLSLKYPKVGVGALTAAVLIMVVGRGQLGVPDWLVGLISIGSGIAIARLFFTIDKKA